MRVLDKFRIVGEDGLVDVEGMKGSLRLLRGGWFFWSIHVNE